MTQAVMEYLAERRKNWLDKRLSADMDEAETLALETEANERFSLAQWLPDAAKRASQLPMSTHPSKFTHSSAKTSPVIFERQHTNNLGYLCSGAVTVTDLYDASGNAAAMDVYSLLNLELSDEKSVLYHLENNTPLAQSLLQKMSADADEQQAVCKGLLSMKYSDKAARTDYLVKQVYFPTSDGYHLLSVLTPSGLVFELKKRIQELRFSDKNKEARVAKRNQEFHAEGFDEILDLTVFGYGGSKPQTVSVLNSKNRGESYLLPCKPPKLDQRAIRLPSRDFFKQTLFVRDFDVYFKSLFELMALDINNMHIRDGIRKVLHKIVDEVMYRAFCVREFAGGWSQTEHYQALPKAQQLWLDAELIEARLEDDEWQEAIAKALRQWLAGEIERRQNHIKLGDAEHLFLQATIVEVLAADKEYF